MPFLELGSAELESLALLLSRGGRRCDAERFAGPRHGLRRVLADRRAYLYHGATHAKRTQCFGGATNHMVVMPDADLDRGLRSWVPATARLARAARRFRVVVLVSRRMSSHSSAAAAAIALSTSANSPFRKSSWRRQASSVSRSSSAGSPRSSQAWPVSPTDPRRYPRHQTISGRFNTRFIGLQYELLSNEGSPSAT
jgi:hypothetical protein